MLQRKVEARLAIVYNVDGLRDAVKDEVTGIITKENTPERLADEMHKISNDQNRYEKMRENAFVYNGKFNFDRSYNKFKEEIGI